MIPKWPGTLHSQSYPLHGVLITAMPKFNSFHSTMTRLPDNFSSSYNMYAMQWWIWNLRKKGTLWETLRRKIEKKFGVIWRYVECIAFEKFVLIKENETKFDKL